MPIRYAFLCFFAERNTYLKFYRFISFSSEGGLLFKKIVIGMKTLCIYGFLYIYSEVWTNLNEEG